MKKQSPILIHTDELNSFGIKLKPMKVLHEKDKAAHRDDHYMFILQQKGSFVCEIDFKEIKLTKASLCFVLPGQVHRYLQQRNNTGWFMFADTALVDEQHRTIFDTYQHVHQVIAVQPDDPVFNTLPILDQLLHQEHHSLKSSLIASVTETVTGMIAAKLIQPRAAGRGIGGQKYAITTRFKQLVKQQYKELKQVMQYADQLNITPLYLNEVMKEITGFPASYWIQQEVILEAKRLLYYTTLDVKQVAYELGFEDHTYFSRFFKKNAGTTALAFRKENHDMSNHSH